MYTIYIKAGIVKRDSDGVQVMPAQSVDHPDTVSYLQWVQQGNAPTPDYSDPVEVLLMDAKASRQQQIDDLHVVYNGKTFDANEASQGRIARNVAGMAAGSTTTWVLHNNVLAEVTREELQAVLELAVAQTTAIWTAPYLSLPPVGPSVDPGINPAYQQPNQS